ncbi:unnamed protein product [Dibothriocephalus latus]|uniref:Uncharacterized protein n=1 Tax=Dibothriocephalus latus TaxID=60516 RepID=A0A3P7NU13_DIBLA|nr:unnamed protein product [Dibothriocephalus latus]
MTNRDLGDAMGLFLSVCIHPSTIPTEYDTFSSGKPGSISNRGLSVLRSRKSFAYLALLKSLRERRLSCLRGIGLGRLPFIRMSCDDDALVEILSFLPPLR